MMHTTREVFILLNPITAGPAQIGSVGPFKDFETAANAYLENLLPEPVEEEGPDPTDKSGVGTKMWLKHFKSGTPFEWCRPLRPNEYMGMGAYGHGFVRITKRLGLPKDVFMRLEKDFNK